MLDFVSTPAAPVADQRCIDLRASTTAIRFDEQIAGEVVINEASCTGCTLCAQACPYEAIELVDVEDRGQSDLPLRASEISVGSRGQHAELGPRDSRG